MEKEKNLSKLYSAIKLLRRKKQTKTQFFTYTYSWYANSQWENKYIPSRTECSNKQRYDQ